MDCHISGAGMISPQKTYDNDAFLSELTQYDNNVLTCVLPDFKDNLQLNSRVILFLSRLGG